MRKTKTESNKISKEQNAVNRLRKSRQELENELRSEGNTDGQNFVLTDDWADAACQRHLERANSAGREFGSFSELAKVLCGDDGWERDWEEIFRAKYGDNIEEPEWIEGFVAGAVQKFREIEQKL